MVSGKCPPLLSKAIATKLGLLIDTESHTVASRMYHVKAFGLGMAVNGHYLLSITGSDETHVPIPEDFQMPNDTEVYPLSRSGSKQVVDNFMTETTKMSIHADWTGRRDGREPKDRGPGRGGVPHDRRGGAGRTAAADCESSQKLKTRKQNVMKATRRPRSTAAASSAGVSSGQVKAMQEQMGQMQQMFLQMKEMMGLQRDLMQPATEEVEDEDNYKREKQKEKSYPTLSTMFSDDLTWNIILSIKSQSITFKWKMLLLLMRVKRAMEHEIDKDKGTRGAGSAIHGGSC